MSEYTIGIGQLRSAVLHYLDLAAGGDTIFIVRRGKSLARMYSLDPSVAVGERRCSCTPNAVPIRASISALRAQAARYFDRIAAGEAVNVICRGREVAHICSCG